MTTPRSSTALVATMPEHEADAVAPTGKPWSGGGREELAAAVRRLVTSTVNSMASPEELLDAAERTAALAEELDRSVQVPGPVPTGRFADRSVQSEDPVRLAAAMPFDMIIGSCNPVALPITIEFEPPRAIGRANFTAPYEGAPGCVHGAVLAGAFDMMLTAANVLANGAGPTVQLSIRYLKPTLIDQPAVFEAWVTRFEGNRTHSEGQLIQGGVVTVEAVGEFIRMERSRVASMHRREDGNPSAG
jgi:acyl-coenzyme A thioesterase PaaI-like protein